MADRGSKLMSVDTAAVRLLGRFASDSGDADIQAIFDKIKANRNGLVNHFSDRYDYKVV